VLHPKICEQWHPTKNGALKPEKFTPGQAKKFGGSVLKVMIMNGRLE